MSLTVRSHRPPRLPLVPALAVDFPVGALEIAIELATLVGRERFPPTALGLAPVGLLLIAFRPPAGIVTATVFLGKMDRAHVAILRHGRRAC